MEGSINKGIETMKEYQFKIHNVVLDVHAESEEEAVRTLNDSLHLLDEPLPAPGRIQRVLVDVQEPVSTKNIVAVYDFDTHESYEPNAQGQGTKDPTDTMNSNVRLCRHVDDVPLTVILASGPRRWKSEPCQKPAMHGSDYCYSHAWIHGECVMPTTKIRCE